MVDWPMVLEADEYAATGPANAPSRSEVRRASHKMEILERRLTSGVVTGRYRMNHCPAFAVFRPWEDQQDPPLPLQLALEPSAKAATAQILASWDGDRMNLTLTGYGILTLPTVMALQNASCAFHGRAPQHGGLFP